MDGISPNDLLKAIMGSVLKAFYNCGLPVICASVLLKYLLNLVTLDYMLLIMVCIKTIFVGGAAVFDQVGQPSEFAI